MNKIKTFLLVLVFSQLLTLNALATTIKGGIDFSMWPNSYGSLTSVALKDASLSSYPGFFISDGALIGNAQVQLNGWFTGDYVRAAAVEYLCPYSFPSTFAAFEVIDRSTNATRVAYVYGTGSGTLTYSVTAPEDITNIHAYGSGYGIVTKQIRFGDKLLSAGPYARWIQNGLGQPGSAYSWCVACHGWPVNIANGELWHQTTDFEIKGQTPDTSIKFTRTWVHDPAARSNDFNNWRNNFETTLLWQDPGNIIWIDEGGGPWTFTKSGSSYVAPPGLQATLTEYSNRYELRKSNGIVYTFNLSGQLTKITERHGVSIDITYDSDDKIYQISEPLIGTLTFARNSDGRVSTITRDRDGLVYTYTYNGYGFLTQVEDSNSLTDQYTYDLSGSGPLNGFTDKGGRTTTFTYYGSGPWQGRAYQQHEPSGGTRTFTYGVSGTTPYTTVTEVDGYDSTYYFDNYLRTTRVVYPDSTEKNYTWNSAGYVATVTDENSGVTYYGYDSNGNVNSVTRPADSSATTTTWDSTYNIPSAKTPTVGGATTYTLDSGTGDVLSETRGGVTSTFTRDAFGNALTTDNGITTYTNTANSSGQVTYKYDAHNPETITYDSRGRIHTRTFQTGRVLTYSYDDYDRETQVIDTDGPTVAKTYDDIGNLLTKTVGTGTGAQVTTYVYDNRDRLVSVTDALGRVTTYAYDTTHISKNPISITTPGSKTTLFEYNNRGRLTKRTDAEGAETNLTYDAKGNLSTITDHLGNVTTFAYDGNNRKTSETRKSVAGSTSSNRVTEFTYDGADRLTKVKTHTVGSGEDRVINYTYDSLDRLTAKTVGTETPDVTLTPKSMWNRLKSAFGGKKSLDTTEESATYSYTSQLDANVMTSANNGVVNLGFTSTATPPFTNETFTVTAAQTGNPLGLQEGTFTIGRDTSGEVSSVIDPSSNTLVTNTFDDAGRLLTASSGTFTSTLTYDSFGRKDTLTHSDGPSAVFTYDKLNRNTEVAWSGATPVDEQLSFNTAGNVTGITREHGSYTLTYDNVDQLLTSSTSGSGTFVNYNRTLSYDLVGNRTGDSVNGTGTFVSNFLTGNTAMSFTGDSDGFGTVSSKTVGSTTHSFSYRSDDRLSGYTVGSTSAVYYYDALGRRIAKEINLGSGAFYQSYTYLGNTDRVLAGKSGSGTSTVYVEGQGNGEHLGEVTGSTVKGYITDHLGSVLNSSPAGAGLQYGLFGEATGTTSVSTSLQPAIWGFAGQMYDPESGLNYTKFRQYDSSVGRWISQEPLVSDSLTGKFLRDISSMGEAPDSAMDVTAESRRLVNAYEYAVANPVLFVDYDGRFAGPVLTSGWVGQTVFGGAAALGVVGGGAAYLGAGAGLSLGFGCLAAGGYVGIRLYQAGYFTVHSPFSF